MFDRIALLLGIVVQGEYETFMGVLERLAIIGQLLRKTFGHAPKSLGVTRFVTVTEVATRVVLTLWQLKIFGTM